jgi:hypothetical protein
MGSRARGYEIEVEREQVWRWADGYQCVVSFDYPLR